MDDINNIIVFLKALRENIPEEWGKIVEYTCPICGGTVKCVRSDYNGHIHAKCEKCDMAVME